MKTDLGTEPLLDVLASVLGLTSDEVAARAADDSFVGLGGNSVDAMDFVARAEEELGLVIEMGHLLGLAPVANVLAACVPGGVERPVTTGGPQAGRYRPAVAEQEGFLSAERFVGGTVMHQIISGELLGPLDWDALRETIHHLVDRHEALRTLFEETKEGYRRRVLPSWRPDIIRQRLSVAAGDDPVEAVHTTLSKGSALLVSATGRPPFAIVLTTFGERHHLLSLVVHHALADGWAVGLMWREMAAHYGAMRAGLTLDADPAPIPDLLDDRRTRLTVSGALQELTARRVAQLDGFPTVVEVPGDTSRPARFDFHGARLHFGLSSQARDAVERVAARSAVTHTTVLLSAWQLVIARRCGLDRFLMGISVAGRTDAASMRLVAPCAALVPIRCEVGDEEPVDRYVKATSKAVAEGVTFAAVPYGDLSRGLRAVSDGRRVPLVQVVFSAQDAFLPHRLDAGELEIRLHEAFSGWTAADVSLFVLRWGDTPRLALEYATSVLTPAEAAGLTEAFEATVLELAAGYDEPLSQVRAMSGHQRAILGEWRRGAPPVTGAVPSGSPLLDRESGLWQILQSRAAERPDDVAVHEAARGITLTYRELVNAAAAQAAALVAAGVGEGDQVGIALPRSAEEVVALLAALRTGASYLPLDAASPPERTARVLTLARPAAIIGTAERLDGLRGLLPPGCAELVPLPVSGGAEPVDAPDPAPADPDRVAYTIFTSGSTGEPKGVRVRHRGVIRLFGRDGHAPMGPGDRGLRLGTLSFDISVVEIFNPLLSGATLEIFPDELSRHATLAAFLKDNGVTVMILTPALFRTVAEHRPDAFAGVRHLMVGGDVVPSGPVRALLERYPGLVISNAYGPTENGVVTTQHGMADPCEVAETLPIGRPIAHSGVVVLDERGGLVPPGGIGELCCTGDGLAVDYLDDPVRTKEAFGTFEGERVYRSGDLVRWDGQGRLRFHGRRDGQIKIRGYRIETGEVRTRIGAHPAVADVVVAAVGESESKRLMAAITLREPIALEEVRRFAGEGLPRYMMPELWAVVDEMPVTSSGKHDLRQLERLAVSPSHRA